MIAVVFYVPVQTQDYQSLISPVLCCYADLKEYVYFDGSFSNDEIDLTPIGAPQQ